MFSYRTRIAPRLVAGAGVLMMIATAAACGSDTSSNPSTDQTLRIAEAVEQPTLDPAKNIQYLSDEMAAIYDTLVVIKADGTIGPSLAESWTIDGASITFKLRSGVKFHDGTPFDAEAVKYALDRVVDPNTKATNSKSVLGPYDKAEVIDPTTVKVTWKSPVGAALINLANADLSIPSPTAAKAGTLEQKPVGTGPYKFVNYVKGDRLEVERNPDYTTIRPDLTNKAAPKYAKIVFQYVTNASTRANLVSTGGVEIAQLTGPDAKRLANAPNLKNTAFPGVSETALWINAKKVPDVNVRKAISAAIDRDALIQAIASGYAEVNYSVLPTIVPGHDKSAGDGVTKYGKDQAKQLLQAAGYTAGSDGTMTKNGQPLTLNILSSAEDPWPAIDQLVQDQLAQVGIKATIKTEEFATVTQTRRKGDQDIYIGRYGILDPAGSMNILFACANIPSATVPLGTNLTFNCNTEVDAALRAAITESDDAKRATLLSTAQRQMAADHTALVLYQPQSVVFSAKSVSGIGMQPDGILKINDLAPSA
ncbi:ABC transporter substrate-binding protein [Dactylosporangium fulvum]|uniref:ABC transporter substrate-binding protein n=1 Tax=Dactylosporangium fulvum TaxID=53359 RepID=A0ABY5VR31_9ACTN|nr:ABC transporter substrate-binding protein [Dactylosporangium fulvum]UWP79990.1 ABC transporter substrate-binding protein [Dactylosporangium fulvum]